MPDNVLLVVAVLAPVLGSLLLPLLGPISPRLRNAVSFLLVLAALVCSVCLIPTALNGKQPVVGGYLPGMGDHPLFTADALAVFTACVSAFISAIVVIYSTGYIREYEHQNEYYFMVTLFLGSMMGLVYAANLAVLYVFWELTAVASWRLIGFFREKEHVRKADKAFLVTAFGALAMLLGFVSIAVAGGSLELSVLKDKFPNGLPDLSVGLILLGILSKSATLPLHTWLPDAGVAPSPVTALLHAAVLVKIGVYVFARLFLVTFLLSADWQTTVLVIAAASALVSAAAAMLDNNLKRIIAYSTVSQIAFIFLGFASGTAIGAAGGMLYILMHGLAKGGLFLCAGIVEHTAHTKDIRKMGGLIRVMPVTAVCFLLCAFSVMGIPPFGGFFSKYMVIGGAIQGKHQWIALVFVAGAVMTLLYLLRVFRAVFLGPAAEVKHEAGEQTAHAAGNEGIPVMVGSVVVLAALGLVAGIAIYPPTQFALKAVTQMLGLVK